MKKLSLVSLAFAAALAFSPTVLLGQSEDFTINITDVARGIYFGGSGTFSTIQAYEGSAGGASPTTLDGYLITSFSGNLSVPGSPAGSGHVTLIQSTNQGGNFIVDSDIQADDLLFVNDDVAGAVGSGYLDNSGMELSLDGYDVNVNIFTGQSIYVGSGGLPYWVIFSISGSGYSGYNISTASDPGDLSASVTVPESSSLSMLALCLFGLAGGFFFRARHSGLIRRS